MQFGSRATPVVELDDDRNCATELNSLGAILRVSLREVCHSQNHYVTGEECGADYGSTCPDSSPDKQEERRTFLFTNQITTVLTIL